MGEERTEKERVLLAKKIHEEISGKSKKDFEKYPFFLEAVLRFIAGMKDEHGAYSADIMQSMGIDKKELDAALKYLSHRDRRIISVDSCDSPYEASRVQGNGKTYLRLGPTIFDAQGLPYEWPILVTEDALRIMDSVDGLVNWEFRNDYAIS